MFELSTVTFLVIVAVVVVLGMLLVKVINKPEVTSEEGWEVGPTCKPNVVPIPLIPESDPASGQKLDPVEVKEILDIIKNQPEELVAPPVLSQEFNPIIQPPPEKKVKAVAKKTPVKKPKQPAKRKTKK
jgi:hypothetical protein